MYEKSLRINIPPAVYNELRVEEMPIPNMDLPETLITRANDQEEELEAEEIKLEFFPNTSDNEMFVEIIEADANDPLELCSDFYINNGIAVVARDKMAMNISAASENWAYVAAANDPPGDDNGNDLAVVGISAVSENKTTNNSAASVVHDRMAKNITAATKNETNEFELDRNRSEGPAVHVHVGTAANNIVATKDTLGGNNDDDNAIIFIGEVPKPIKCTMDWLMKQENDIISGNLAFAITVSIHYTSTLNV